MPRSLSRLPHLVDAEDISNWSRRIDSFSQFPGIIRMLLKRNNDQITRLDMRDAEGVRAPGYDGTLEALRGTPLVPMGRSVWELGVNSDFKSKARREYDKRTKDSLGENQAETTFVFVTPHRWQGKEKWERKCRESGPWRDVRVFDVDNLMDGLDEARAVHIRLSDILGKPAAGVRSIERWWEAFRARSSPAVSAEIALAGRADHAAELLMVLDESRTFTTIRAKSVDDVLGFVVATMLTTSPVPRTELLARTVIVHDASALRQLDGSETLLILLPFEEQMRREAELVRSNHVLFMCEDDVPADVELSNIDIAEVTRLLISQGVERELATELGQAAGVSLKKFQRVASQQRGPQPAWNTAFSDRDVCRAWLLRSWTTARSGDLDVFEQLVGKSFSDVEEPLRQAARGADPVFSTVGAVWSVVSPADFWDHVRPHLSASDHEALQRTVQDVLGAVDPALELPPEERWLAAMRKMARIHSRELRRGLATTLALVGVNGETTMLGGGVTGGTWVRGVLHSLFSRANNDSTGQLWASLTDVLPLLAEAAPDIFLSALDSAIRNAETALSHMFTDKQGGSFTSTSAHTGLLWALEVTAWLPAHFSQSVNALAALSEIDPGGRLSNRPFNSLKDVYWPRFPQTLVGRADRLASLAALAGRRPDVGSRLLIELLPCGHDSAMSNNATPKFWARVTDPPRVNAREWIETTAALVSQVLPILRARGELWPDFLGHLSHLPPADRDRVYVELPQSIKAIKADQRNAVWQKATDLIRRHREYHDAPWALPEDELDRFEQAIAGAKPEDARDRNRWLFDNIHPDIGIREVSDVAGCDREISKLRADAVNGFWMSTASPACKCSSRRSSTLVSSVPPWQRWTNDRQHRSARTPRRRSPGACRLRDELCRPHDLAGPAVPVRTPRPLRRAARRAGPTPACRA